MKNIEWETIARLRDKGLVVVSDIVGDGPVPISCTVTLAEGVPEAFRKVHPVRGALGDVIRAFRTLWLMVSNPREYMRLK